MKGSVRLCLCVLFCLPLSLSLLAQQQPAPKGSMDKPQMLVVYDDMPKPGHLADYERSTKDFLQEMVNTGPEVEWNAAMTDDLHYYYIIPIPGSGAIDEMNSHIESMMKSMGMERVSKMMAELGESVRYTDARIAVRRDDLSFHPSNADIKPEETKVLQYDFYYLNPGADFAAEQVSRDYAALFAKKKITTPFTVYQVTFGPDMPLLVVVVPAKSEVDLAQRNEKVMAAVGDEMKALDQRAMSLIRKFDRKIGHPRPDLARAGFKPAPKK